MTTDIRILVGGMMTRIKSAAKNGGRAGLSQGIKMECEESGRTGINGKPSMKLRVMAPKSFDTF